MRIVIQDPANPAAKVSDLKAAYEGQAFWSIPNSLMERIMSPQKKRIADWMSANPVWIGPRSTNLKRFVAANRMGEVWYIGACAIGLFPVSGIGNAYPSEFIATNAALSLCPEDQLPVVLASCGERENYR